MNDSRFTALVLVVREFVDEHGMTADDVVDALRAWKARRDLAKGVDPNEWEVIHANPQKESTDE